jgi:hypothetical protein
LGGITQVYSIGQTSSEPYNWKSCFKLMTD